jgi:hypothetical protein
MRLFGAAEALGKSAAAAWDEPALAELEDEAVDLDPPVVQANAPARRDTESPDRSARR